MIIYLPDNSYITPSYQDEGVYFLFKDSGHEGKIVVEEGKIKSSSILLNLAEVEAIRNYIIKPKTHETRFLQLESKM